MRSKTLFATANRSKFTAPVIAEYMFSEDTPSKIETFYDNEVVICPASKISQRDFFEHIMEPYYDYLDSRFELTINGLNQQEGSCHAEA